MKLIRHLVSLPIKTPECVLTIGNFDGVHKGHHAVLDGVVSKAEELGLSAAVMSFDPQPLEYFQPKVAPARLSTAREKISLLAKAGIDQLYMLRFDQRLASMTADKFIDLLHTRLNVKHLVVGDDFSFGKDRVGNFELLQKAALRYGFTVRNTVPFMLSGNRVSSTLIREALSAGDFEQAHCYLGRPYTLSGRVMHGQKRGREIGFPTANIHVKNRKSPLNGVFVVTMTDKFGACFYGVANVGTRPTVDSSTKLILEVHVFDFSGDLYQQRVQISFLKKLRDEMKFSSVEVLKQQIFKDCQQAKNFLTTL
jgi:riboflavin kinase/FMN adenylyltransferase